MAHNDLRPENIYINVDKEKKVTIKMSLSFQFSIDSNNHTIFISGITNFSSPE